MPRPPHIHTKLSTILITVAFIAFPPGNSVASAQCPFDWRPGDPAPGANDGVSTSVTWDPDGDGPQPAQWVVGGRFTMIDGVPCGRIAAWDGAHWSTLADGVTHATDPIFSRVISLFVYRNELIAAGHFTVAGGALATNIARWNGQIWQPLGSGLPAPSPLNTIALASDGDSLYAAGQFANSMTYVAKWNGDLWLPIGQDLFNPPIALAAIDNQLVAGGGQILVDPAGGPAPNYGNYNTAIWNGSEWNGIDLANGFGSNTCFAVFSNTLVAGGSFRFTPTSPTNFIARLDGNAWLPLGDGLNGPVHALIPVESDLMAVGEFSRSGVTPMSRIAQWNGSTWQALGPNAGPISGSLNTAAVFNGQIHVGGSMTQAASMYLSKIARWDGTEWHPLGHGLDGDVNAAAVLDGELILGGAFTTAGGNRATRVVGWRNGVWRPLGSFFTTGVVALATWNHTLFAATDYTSAAAPNPINQWDGADWQPLGTGVNGSVGAFCEFAGSLIVGGAFTTAGGESANRIARWDGSAWHPLGGGMDNTVRATVVYNGDLIAAGDFVTADGNTVNYIAAWDGATWRGLGPGMSSSVQALAVYGGRLIAGGFFLDAGQSGARYLAQWDGNAWTGLTESVNYGVTTFGHYDGRLVASGLLTLAGGAPAEGIALWDGSTWLPVSTANQQVHRPLLQYNDDLVIGGTIQTLEGDSLSGWARWGPACLRGDFNCDHAVTPDDLPDFITAVLDPDTLSACRSHAANMNADVREDGRARIDGRDIAAFAACLTAGNCP